MRISASHRPRLYDIPYDHPACEHMSYATQNQTLHSFTVCKHERRFLSQARYSRERPNRNFDLGYHSHSYFTNNLHNITMCKERKWRYRCDCRTTTIQPCRHRCFENAHPETSLRSMPRDQGRPPCAYTSPTNMYASSGWRGPTECLPPKAYMVGARVCSRGSYRWKMSMESDDGVSLSLKQDLESGKSGPAESDIISYPPGRGSRWRQILMVRAQ